jgi:hypothetical protein
LDQFTIRVKHTLNLGIARSLPEVAVVLHFTLKKCLDGVAVQAIGERKNDAYQLWQRLAWIAAMVVDRPVHMLKQPPMRALPFVAVFGLQFCDGSALEDALA